MNTEPTSTERPAPHSDAKSTARRIQARSGSHSPFAPVASFMIHFPAIY